MSTCSSAVSLRGGKGEDIRKRLLHVLRFSWWNFVVACLMACMLNRDIVQGAQDKVHTVHTGQGAGVHFELSCVCCEWNVPERMWSLHRSRKHGMPSGKLCKQPLKVLSAASEPSPAVTRARQQMERNRLCC